MGYKTIIETTNIVKKFPVMRGYSQLFRAKKKFTVLHNVSIGVREGEIFSLVGPNGAGKTTFIKILCGLILPDEGKAFIKGYDVVQNPELASKSIGYVINEERSFYWRLTGRQNLNFFARLNNILPKATNNRVDRLLDFVGLSRETNKPFKDYSTGMRQRLSIARALLTNPDILFMDEPTKSLDPLIARETRHFVKEEIVRTQGKTVFFATQNLQEAEDLSDRIAIMDKGSIKACGSLDELKKLSNSSSIEEIFGFFCGK